VTYFDTAYLVKCYIKEPGWEEVRALAKERAKICCSLFGRMELAAAFHRQLREGNITERQLEIIITQFEFDETRNLWTWFPVTSDILEKVVKRFRTLPKDLFLRTADALHLITAEGNGVTELFSNDFRMLEAAGQFNLSVENVLQG
jgi:predicted nucleic acid-binding protein